MDGFRLSVISDRRSVVIASYQAWRSSQGTYVMNKCIDCGLLGLLGLVSRASDSIEEAGPKYRQNGTIVTLGKKQVYWEAPICHQKLIHIDATSGQDGYEQACSLPTDECPSFIEYQPGIPPQERYKMSLAEAQEELRIARKDAKSEKEKRIQTKRWFIGTTISLIIVSTALLTLYLKAIQK